MSTESSTQQRPSVLAAQEWVRVFNEEWRSKVILANAIDQHRALLTLKGYRQCEGEVSALLICDVQPGAGPCRTGCKRCEESCTCGADPEPLDYCNAVVWIEESDGVISHYAGPDVPVRSGPAEVWWDGDGWRWGLMPAAGSNPDEIAPADAPVDVLSLRGVVDSPCGPVRDGGLG